MRMLSEVSLVCPLVVVVVAGVVPFPLHFLLPDTDDTNPRRHNDPDDQGNSHDRYFLIVVVVQGVVEGQCND